MTAKYIPDINPEDYNYDLPQERIAKYPLPDRSDSRLLVAKAASGELSHHIFKELPDLLPENSLVIVNSTKVISARIFLKKPTGGKAELLCVDPLEPSTDPQAALQAKNTCRWKCVVGGRKIDPGLILIPSNHPEGLMFEAEILSRESNNAKVEFRWLPEDKSFAEILEIMGTTPLPPYIKREAEESDKSTYQTVYAKSDGSVAAPTAGLHFTDEVTDCFKNKEIRMGEVILHVGPGTFKPIETDSVREHDMHREKIFVTREIIENLIYNFDAENTIIATGTTTLRVLESVYWFGVKLMKGENPDELFIDQNEPYYFSANTELPSPKGSLQAVLSWMEDKSRQFLTGQTQLFIVPGYKFHMIDGLITNYHMPKSTLILLVAAFLGDDLWRQVYEEALATDYRFLSYGDASLLMR